MTSKLISKIRTVEERDKLKEELELLLQSLYTEKGEGFKSALASKTRFWVSEIIKNETSEDIGGTEKYLNEIIAEISKYKVLTLAIAFEPTDISIDKIFSYVRKKVGGDVILDFEFDPGLLGGASIKYQGAYKDFSLKRLFESEYKEKSVEVMKIMYSK